MAQATECVEFTIDELQALQHASDLAHVLKVCFLYGSDEAFHALCAVVQYGKDLAATSKRIKRDARIDLYRKLAVVHHPHAQDPAHKTLSYYEFATSLTTFSERWSTHFPFDELLSLAFVVDRGEYGVISLDVFMSFIEDVDRAFHSNPSYPNEALDAYYDGRRETLFKHVMAAFQSVELRNKLAYLASLACQFHVQPLTALFEMLESDTDMPNEQIVGFIVQLTGTVNHGLKQLEAAQLLIEDMHAQSPQLQQAFSPYSLRASSPHGSVASSGGNGNERLVYSAGSGSKRADPGRQSYASKLFGTVDEGDGGPNEPGAGSGRSSPAASVDLLDYSDRGSTPRSVNSLDGGGSLGGTGSRPAGSRGETPQMPPASAAAILEAVQAFQDKAQQIVETLTPGPKSVGSSTSPTPAPAEENPTTGTETAQTPAGTEAIVNPSTEASVAQASTASVPPVVLPHLLLQQLQQMEAQLHKAKQLMLPIVGEQALSDSGAVGRSTPRSARTPSIKDLHLSSLRINTTGGAPSTGKPGKRLSIATRSPSLTAGSSLFSPTPGSSSVAGPISASRRPSSARRPSLLLDASIDLSVAHQTTAPLSASKFIEMNRRHSRSIASTGKLDRKSPLTRNVDLSIFKSPLNHKRLEPRNVFDNSKLTWVPDARNTSIGSAGRRKERFQSTEDLRVAREVNPVFYNMDL